jgi:nitrite reductase/ring-hydroxylating ferredoxin subunit
LPLTIACLRFADQYLPEPDFTAATNAVRAAAVFVGQGVSAPDIGHDDFAGLDVRGKVAVVLGGAPARLDNDRRAVAASQPEKLRTLAARGAVGAIFVDTAEDEAQLPWSRRVVHRDRAAMRLRDADGRAIDALPQLRVVARVSAAAADLLFDGSGHTAAELAIAARKGELRGFAVPGVVWPVMVTRLDGEIVASTSVCPHEDVLLLDGTLRRGIVTCPGHAYELDLRTGRCLHDARLTLRRYRVTLVDDEVWIDLV